MKQFITFTASGLFIIFFICGLQLPASAQLSINSTGTPYTVNFDATLEGVNNGQYLGTGFTPGPAAGQLNSNAWASTGMTDGNSDFGGTYTTGDFAVGNSPGGVTGGGFYSFTVASGNNVFGVQPTGNDWTPGTVIMKIKNNTGTTIGTLNIAYKIWVFNDQPRANSFNFSYSADNVQYTPVTSLDYISPGDATGAVWVPVDKSTVLENLGIANGSFFYIRWNSDDVSGSGSRDEFGIDDIIISAGGGTVLPEPTNYPTSFSSTSLGMDIKLNWIDATGAQIPTGYLIKVATSSTIVNPVDGTPEPDDLDFSDGTGAKNIAQGVQAYTFTNLTPNTQYFFKIFPYTNSGVNINFKTSGTPPSTDKTTPIYVNNEDFNTGTFGTWTTYNVTGDQIWLIDNTFGIGGTPCAKMSGYSGAPVVNEDWLISPQLDVTQFNNEILSFYSAMNFAGPALSVLLSDNYTGGDPNAADWTEVSDELVFSQGGYQWTFSGYFDMSWISGNNVRVAFRYLSDASGASTWELDNISITGFYSGTNPVLNVIAPAAGAQWQQGTSQNVLWSAINTSPNIKIEVSANASSGNPTWTQIGTAAAIAGSWTWAIPQSQPVGNDYKIRLTDYTSDITAYSGLFSVTAPPTIPDIVLNEIMYNPATALGLDDYYEYVELYNNENTTVDLSGFTFPLGITFTFPQGTTMAAGSYLVVARNIDTLLAYYGPMNITGPFTGALNNSGEAIQLADGAAHIVDEVTYGILAPWPPEPNGTGPSLSLLDPDLDNSLPESWAASAQVNGTPGVSNFAPITVTAPNGGENWSQGTTHDITWNASGISGNVKIELISTTGYQQVLAASVTATAQSWSWAIPAAQPLANNYKIKISEATTGSPSDESDGTFSIIQPVYIPKIVITEIMYNPPETGNDSLEFVEIYNNDAITVDLNNYKLATAVDFTFPQLNLTPGQYQLIAFNAAAIQNTFGKTSLQWTAGSLSNSGEIIELKDSYGNIIDVVPFLDVLPWDTLADGDGPSLTLCDPNLDNGIPESWTHATEFAAINAAGDTIWATPGSGCTILPVADFVANNTSIQTGGNVVFTDLSTGNPTTWAWTFEGGTPGTYNGQTPPAIVYNTAGQYDVTLTVTNNSGSDTEIKTNYITVTVTPPPPGVNFVGNPTTLLQGQPVQFTDQSSNNPTSWAWTFPGGTPGSSTLQNPSITYNTPGVYNVTLTATNQYGSNTLTKTNYITVNAIPPPTANFTANVTNIPAGGSVNFTDQSTGNPTSWSWSFQGGTPATSSQQNPAGIVYNNPGTFNVSLTVSNQYGSNTLTKTGYINVYDPNTAILVITEIMYNPPEVGDDSLEYIEIYNHGNAAANLSGYTFSQGVVFTFGTYSLNPGGYVVVAKNSAAMMNTFGVAAQQWTEGSLSNSGEILELKDAQGNTVDFVQFSDLAPWPTQPDGSGPSLVLCNPALDNNVGSNWFASAEFVTNNGAGQPIYGTPGGPCVTTEVNEIMNNHTFVLYPNPASGSFSVLSDQLGNYRITVMNMLGKTIYSSNSYELNTPVPAESWEKGIYMVSLFHENYKSPVVLKLIIR